MWLRSRLIRMAALAALAGCSDAPAALDGASESPDAAGSPRLQDADDPEAPRVVAEPGRVDFGLVRQGESAERLVWIHNPGPAALQVQRLTLGGAASFSAACGGLPATVPPGAVWTCRVGFHADLPEPRHGTLWFDTDRGTLAIALTGNAAAPCLSVQPVEIGFGQVAVGNAVTRVVRIDNCGAQPAALGRVLLLPGASPGFSLGRPQITPDSLGRVVPPGGAATVAVRYTPRRPSPLQGDSFAPDWAVAVIHAPVLGPVAGFSMRAVARW